MYISIHGLVCPRTAIVKVSQDFVSIHGLVCPRTAIVKVFQDFVLIHGLVCAGTAMVVRNDPRDRVFLEIIKI